MLLWHREIQPVAGASEQHRDEPSPLPGYEAKRQRALQILGEKWLLHRANAPDRRPSRPGLPRRTGDVSAA